MAKAMDRSTQAKQAADVTSVEAQEMLASNGRAMEAALRANGAMLEGMAEVGREIVAFGGERMRCDLEASQSLMQCKDYQEAFQVQCNFAQQATQQYFEEASKLMNLTAQISRQVWAPVEESVGSQAAATHSQND